MKRRGESEGRRAGGKERTQRDVAEPLASPFQQQRSCKLVSSPLLLEEG